MAERPAMRHHTLTDQVDAVVIGTGAGGAPIIARLAAAGCSVVALEAGRWWSPVDDFATDETEQNKLFWLDERLSAGADPLPFGANNPGPASAARRCTGPPIGRARNPTTCGCRNPTTCGC